MWHFAFNNTDANTFVLSSTSTEFIYGQIFLSDTEKHGCAIRLIKDTTTLTNGQSGTYTGNDGKVYRTICIGTQEWVADNLAETKYRNGDWIAGYDAGVYTPISNGDWAAKTTGAMCAYNDDWDNVAITTRVEYPANTGLYSIQVKNDTTGIIIANWASISAVQPFVLSNIPYGTYTVAEIWMFALRTDNVTPSTFTISASNPQQVVEIENEIFFGSVTITKSITDITEDETYFDITLTDGGAVELTGQVRLGEPLTFEDLPLGTYDITEAAEEGYTLTSITPSTVTFDIDNLHEDVAIVNSKDIALTPIKYGALYNWYAATDARKITSSDDWIVPTGANYSTLFNFLNPDADLKLCEAGGTYWIGTNNSTNSANFNARGSGVRRYNDFAFYGIGTIGLYRKSDNNYAVIIDPSQASSSTYYESKSGMAIRLLYTGAGTPTSYTGNDGKVYPVVLIGTQYWIAANLSETKYRNGDWISGYDLGVYTPIANATWATLTTGAMCAYNDDWNNV